MEKLLNTILSILLIAPCVFAVCVFVVMIVYLLGYTDIPFWVDYWKTNCGH